MYLHVGIYVSFSLFSNTSYPSLASDTVVDDGLLVKDLGARAPSIPRAAVASARLADVCNLQCRSLRDERVHAHSRIVVPGYRLETDVAGHNWCSEVVVDLVVQGRVNITGEIADGGPCLCTRVCVFSRYINSV